MAEKKATLVEEIDGKRYSHDSLILDKPAAMKTLGNDLAMKTFRELEKRPRCSMDLSRDLGVNEQKIYYHIDRLEKHGIVYPMSTERRQGMVAKIYNVTSHAFSTKLSEKGSVVSERGKAQVPLDLLILLEPFIKDGRLDAKIIVGAPLQHGVHNATARNDTALLEIGVLLGRILNHSNSLDYFLDTNVTREDLEKSNLILIGSAKTNSVTHEINKQLPLYFDEDKDFRIVSKLTGNTYGVDYDAVIIRMQSPYNKEKSILLLSGKRSIGLISAALAVEKYPSEILRGNVKDASFIAKVVSGLDKDSDGRIDDVKFQE